MAVKLANSIKSFTLVGLIIVIIIAGIPVFLAFTQYQQTMEKSRLAEVKTNFRLLRKNAMAYHLKNGSFVSIANADLGIGAGLPDSCDPGHYYYYQINGVTDALVLLSAYRCVSGGKSPAYIGTQYRSWMYVYSDGAYSVGCQNIGESGNTRPWCAAY
jgi:Tfp pilus assembly protein PilE